MEEQRRTPADGDPFYGVFRKASHLATQGRRQEAERLLDTVRWRGELEGKDRDQAFAIGTRLRIQFDGAPESDLDVYLSPGMHEYTWTTAVYELLELRKLANDTAGQIAILEALVDRRISHPSLEANPFPYAQKWASRKLAELHLSLGDGRKGYEWASRYKHEFDADFDAPCGAWISQEFDEMEGLLEKTAAMAGWVYHREPGGNGSLESKYRRMYGPPTYECVLGMATGGALAFLGVWWGWGPERKRLSWRIFWSPRGLLGKVGWGSYTGGFAGCLLLVARSALEGPLPPPQSTLTWLGFLSLGYLAFCIPFLGSFIAERGEGSGRRVSEVDLKPSRCAS
jgi:hypothetical protein